MQKGTLVGFNKACVFLIDSCHVGPFQNLYEITFHIYNTDTFTSSNQFRLF